MCRPKNSLIRITAIRGEQYSINLNILSISYDTSASKTIRLDIKIRLQEANYSNESRNLV